MEFTRVKEVLEKGQRVVDQIPGALEAVNAIQEKILVIQDFLDAVAELARIEEALGSNILYDEQRTATKTFAPLEAEDKVKT